MHCFKKLKKKKDLCIMRMHTSVADFLMILFIINYKLDFIVIFINKKNL